MYFLSWFKIIIENDRKVFWNDFSPPSPALLSWPRRLESSLAYSYMCSDTYMWNVWYTIPSCNQGNAKYYITNKYQLDI